MEKYNLEQTGQEVQNILNEATQQSELTAETERAQLAEQQLQNDIDAIEEKIPSGASSSNKLATEEYVDDSVSTATATFRGTFNLVSDLGLTVDATEQQIAAALASEISTADNNDYCFVQIPTSDETATEIEEIDRYKFNGTAWSFEYELNNSGFTADQWNAINSHITIGDVAKLLALPTNAELTILLNGKQNVLTFDNVPTENSNNPVKSGGVYSAIDDEKGARLNSDAALQQSIDGINGKIPSDASSENKLATASDVDDEATARSNADQSLQDAIEAILLLIPTAASSLNQLADKAFVNSSIATNTATFRGTFNLVNDLHLTLAATHAQVGNALALAIQESDNNDYCFVQIPTVETAPNEIAQTDRYKFNGSTWEYEYTLNNSGFTSAQWIAINSGITSVLVSKLSELPTNSELTSELGALTTAINNINLKIPAAAAQNNKLVDIAALEAYIIQVLDVLTVTYNVTSSDGHVTFHIEQTDGKITAVTLTTNDIASANDLTVLAGRVTTAENDIDALEFRVGTNEADIALLQAAYAGLTQSDIIIGALPASGVANKIYRVPGTNSYSDYMWNGTQFVLMATYNNAIDPRPKKASQNLVTSGGIFDNMGALDISELNATENPHTLATYADLSAALAAIPSNDYKKGGMSIKFVQTDDNKYVQYRLMSNSFNTTVDNWQGVDNVPVAGSENLVKSGGIVDFCLNEFGKIKNVYQGQIDGSNGNINNSVIWSAYTDLIHTEKPTIYRVTSKGSLVYQIFGVCYYKLDGSFDHWQRIGNAYCTIDSDLNYRLMIVTNPLQTVSSVEVDNIILESLENAFDEIEKTNTKILQNNIIFTNSIGFNPEKHQGIINADNGVIQDGIIWGVYTDLIPLCGGVTIRSTNPQKDIIINCIVIYDANGNFVKSIMVKDYYYFPDEVLENVRVLLIDKRSSSVITAITSSDCNFKSLSQPVFKPEIESLEKKIIANLGSIITPFQGGIDGTNGQLIPDVVWGLYTDLIKTDGIVVESTGETKILIRAIFQYDSNGNYVSKTIVDSDTFISDVTLENVRLFLLAEGGTSTVIPITPDDCVIKSLNDNQGDIVEENIDICLSTIYGVVGDTVQIFFNSIIDGYSKDLVKKVVCNYGRMYEDYWECTPTEANNTTFKLGVYSNSGVLLAEKTVDFIIKAPTNANKKILIVGDSRTMDGEYPIELSRRLKGTTGVATTPAPLNLTGFDVVGRKMNGDETVGWEGTGGWSWSTYLSATGNQGARFYVTNGDNIHIGDIYRLNGFTQQFQVTEKNVTAGVGNVMAIFYSRDEIYNDHSLLPTSGTLTKVSGYGQNTISFNNAQIESYQPFWNTTTNQFDIASYVNTYCGGSIDYLFVLLGTNALVGKNPFNVSGIMTIINNAKTFIDLVHTQLPNTKILLSKELYFAQKGGAGVNYFTDSIIGQWSVKAMNHRCILLNKLYEELANDANYSDFVYIVDTNAQFDAINGYPEKEKLVNIRSTVYESIATNLAHPMGIVDGVKWNNGIWMVADALFRALICIANS